MLHITHDDVLGKGRDSGSSDGGEGASRDIEASPSRKRKTTSGRSSHSGWMRDSRRNVHGSVPGVHVVHEVHAGKGSATPPASSISGTIWRDNNGKFRRSREGKGEDTRGEGGGEIGSRRRRLRRSGGGSVYLGYTAPSWQHNNSKNNNDYSAEYLGSSSLFSQVPEVETESPIDSQTSLSTTKVFRRHDDAVELEFFMKAGIACAVLLGFVLWFSATFWCNAKGRRGQRRAGRGWQRNNQRYVCVPCARRKSVQTVQQRQSLCLTAHT